MTQEWQIWGVVTKIHDGDTFTADLDLGWHLVLKGRTVRIAHINAPELKEVIAGFPVRDNPAGIAARDHLAMMIPPGIAIKLISHEVDKYGRCLADVVAGSLDVGAQMIANGYAVPYEGGAK